MPRPRGLSLSCLRSSMSLRRKILVLRWLLGNVSTSPVWSKESSLRLPVRFLHQGHPMAFAFFILHFDTYRIAFRLCLRSASSGQARWKIRSTNCRHVWSMPYLACTHPCLLSSRFICVWQLRKESLSKRIVDDKAVERHFSKECVRFGTSVCIYSTFYEGYTWFCCNARPPSRRTGIATHSLIYKNFETRTTRMRQGAHPSCASKDLTTSRCCTSYGNTEACWYRLTLPEINPTELNWHTAAAA